MTEALALAQEQVREVVRELQAVSFRLLGVHASLPPSPEEVSREDMDQMDPVTELRSVIGNVLRDCRTIIRDLADAVDYADLEPAVRRQQEDP